MASNKLLLGIENPLLDITVVGDDALLAKYDIKVDNAILAEEKHLPIYEELVKMPGVQYTAGGSCQNVIRTAQWMLGKTNPSTIYIGCVGNDDYANKLRQAISETGVHLEYLVDPVAPTGTCAVVVTGTHRSLVANLGAANCYKEEHLRRPDIWQQACNAKFIYSTGFFLTVSPPSLLLLAEMALKENKVVAFNFSAPFISKFFKEPLLKVLPYVDFLFGNESEAQAFAEELQFAHPSDIPAVATWLSSYEKHNQKRKRVVVITQGSNPTIAVDESGVVHVVPIVPIACENIVDTNGAGDAFTGGFLSQLVLGKPLETCIQSGHYAANVVIQRSGCTFPEKSSFSCV